MEIRSRPWSPAPQSAAAEGHCMPGIHPGAGDETVNLRDENCHLPGAPTQMGEEHNKHIYIYMHSHICMYAYTCISTAAS